MTIRSEKLTNSFLSKHPDVAARVLEKLDPAEVLELFEELPVRIIEPVVRNMSSMTAAQSVRMMDLERQVALFGDLGVRVSANIIRLWPPQERHQLFRKLPKRFAMGVTMLLSYPADSVGAIMNTEYISANFNQTIGDIEEYLRKSRIDQQSDVYITDDNQRLKGVVSIMRVLQEDNPLKVRQVMERKIPSILASSYISDVISHAGWEFSHTLPVVDRDKRLIGTLHRTLILNQLESRSEVDESNGYLASDIINTYWSGWKSVITAILADTTRTSRPSA